MKAKFMLLILSVLLSFFINSNLMAQILEDLDDEIIYKTDIIEIQHEQKSAAKAMALSALFPGTGQFYISKKNLTAYIFPIIEISLWYTFFSFDKKGNDVTTDYKKFANDYYSRQRQHEAETHLIDYLAIYPGNIYTTEHFRLEDKNTQHFYEDIGKYNKYIFGWEDWYYTYFREPSSNELRVQWIISGENTGNPADVTWIGNKRISDGQVVTTDKGSSHRDEYVKMRQEAEDHYANRRTMNFLILMNHAISMIDANRVTKKYNREYIKTTSLQPQLKTALVNNNITPVLGLNFNF